MAKRGRRSAASNIVALDLIKTRPRITAPSMLNQQERALFMEVVASNPHLREADRPNLTTYGQAIARTYRFARKADKDSSIMWKEAGRLALAYARSMRLTPINLTHKTTVARQHANAAPASYYQSGALDDDE